MVAAHKNVNLVRGHCLSFHKQNQSIFRIKSGTGCQQLNLIIPLFHQFYIKLGNERHSAMNYVILEVKEAVDELSLQTKLHKTPPPPQTNERGRVVTAPDTLQHSFYNSCRVEYPCVCLFFFFEMPLWTCLASQERFWDKGFSLGSQTINQHIFPRVLFFFYFIHPPIFFWGSIPLSEVNRYGRIILSVFSCRFVPYFATGWIALGFIWKWRGPLKGLYFPSTSVVKVLGWSGSFNLFFFLKHQCLSLYPYIPIICI